MLSRERSSRPPGQESTTACRLLAGTLLVPLSSIARKRNLAWPAIMTLYVHAIGRGVSWAVERDMSYWLYQAQPYHLPTLSQLMCNLGALCQLQGRTRMFSFQSHSSPVLDETGRKRLFLPRMLPHHPSCTRRSFATRRHVRVKSGAGFEEIQRLIHGGLPIPQRETKTNPPLDPHNGRQSGLMAPDASCPYRQIGHLLPPRLSEPSSGAIIID
jgi:hypothetical protein